MTKIVQKAGIEDVMLVRAVVTKNFPHSMCSSEQKCKLIDESGSPNLRRLIDTNYVATTGEKMVTGYLENLANYLDHIHFVDEDPSGLLILGDGMLDMADMLKVTEESGSRGIIV